MNFSRPLLFLSFFSLSFCVHTQEKQKVMNISKHKFTNHLIHETSPYLLQHAHNPVNWYPWGEEALKKAKKENKLIIISIGYSACHWCHVMEHESFEDDEVANFMNEHFIAIKVDREERPDIDQVYMNAVQLISGSGGWPLNCIALPDGRPFYGGTYFRKAQWIDMLSKVAEYVRQDPDKAEEQAASLTQGIRSQEDFYSNESAADFTINDLDEIFNNWKENIDYEKGGFNRAPKFPLPVGYQYLLFYNHISRNQNALDAVVITLDKMSEGGIYDQIGGGFARYSTDENWKVPHFEKMLYDNAQLVSLYAAAYQKTKNPSYKLVVSETLEYIKREMSSKEGGFYSALDADSEGVEGKFYVWTKNEMQEILGDNSGLIMDYYNISEKGNWEDGQNILFITKSKKEIAEQYNITESDLELKILESKQILFKERKKRIHPGLDDKILTSWNALMLKGYVDAYRALDDEEYLDIALKSAEFINKKIKQSDNRLYRSYKDGKATINGFLDDYAFTIAAFISLYQATFDESWLYEAEELLEYTLIQFKDKNSRMFYYTSDIDTPLVARKLEVSDNVIPSANSEMAKNLYILGKYLYKEDYIDQAKEMLNSVKQSAVSGAAYYANWDMLMAWFAADPFEVAIVGHDYESKRKEFDRNYFPNVFLLGGKDEGNLSLLKNKLVKGSTIIYVCQDNECKFPVSEVSEALQQIVE